MLNLIEIFIKKQMHSSHQPTGPTTGSISSPPIIVGPGGPRGPGRPRRPFFPGGPAPPVSP